MKFIDVLEEEKILLNYHFISKKRLFEQVGQLLGESRSQGLFIYHSLLDREKLGNTSLGTGVALPHGRCLKTDEIRACLIKLSHPADYEAVDNQPVQIVVGLVFPLDVRPEHRRFLKETAHLFRQHVLYEQLVNIDDKHQMMDTILEAFEQCNN
ncbi:PTS sugar transporter subunit IIA [Marinicella pacifica]|jgi:PTS system nitrogen regulatory IIA component|uniref:PTS sugar transporter subunit IIA n=1 Tax=Marinicella pacifica TaxID=1171543 RepID=A0A917FMV6_9GAMM|nr:PTS sugar transporter subunit IIA [Marinicella pacifica]GGF90519.1 PTS sugar transporter subunit IIA [Marinicella pacifica]